MADQIPTSFAQCVLKTPLTVAANLRYLDSNGDLVTRLYPNEYISLIGGELSTLKAQYAAVNTILGQYDTRLDDLEADVTAIQTSGVTFMLYVNGGCLLGNSSQRIDTAVTALIDNSCAYNAILGTTTALAVGVAAISTSTLNALPAYSQNSAMSGLSGWDSNPSTTAAWMNNISKAYLDMRTGVTQALNQSNVTCSNVSLNYQGVYNMSSRTISMYFYGSSIPTNFSGSSSTSGTFTITDTAGNTYTQTFNLYNIVSAGSITLNISASALLQNSAYTAVLTYALTSTTPSLGCNGGIPGTVVNNTQTCPNLTATALSASVIQFSFTPTIVDNVTYTVDLVNTSGVTSGTTVISTKTYVNPAAVTTDTFINLTTATMYYVRVSVTVDTVTTVCPSVSATTS